MIRLLVPALALAAAAATAQDLYRWKDAAGRVHITDTPPPPGASDVQKLGQPAAPSAPAEPYALAVARKNYPVTLYTAPECAPCGEARKLLNARGIPFTEVSVHDEKSIAELKGAVGSNSVPSIVVGASVQKGFAESVYQQMLDAAGYPKQGVLPPRNQAEPSLVQPAPVEPAATAEPALGPYAPGAPRQPRPQKR